MTAKIDLKHYVDQIIVQLLPAAAVYKCKFENTILPGTNLNTDSDAFLFVVNRLLKLLVQSSYKSCIHISTVREGDKLSLIIKDDNNDYRGFISGKMEKHQSIIKKAGCCLSFEFNEKKSITIILRFTGQPTGR